MCREQQSTTSKNNASEIEQFASRMESQDGRIKKRKTMEKASNEVPDTSLYLWFIQKHSEGIPLSGPLLTEKALFFNTKLNGDSEFKASNGWLEKFKNRHGIRELNIEGEKMDAANIETVNAFVIKFQQMIAEKGLTRYQVYNADECFITKHFQQKHLLFCLKSMHPASKCRSKESRL